jgi:hypothetical protein
VYQEAAQELLGRDSHQPALSAVRIVFPLEGDFVIGESDQPVIGDRYPVCVAGQVLENVFRSAERRLG